MLTSVVGVVVLLGGLIFFHEFGHYIVAKYFKIKVEVFSMGFGKKLLNYKWGETEYCLSLVPLGGYVKLAGDDPTKPIPPEDAARAFYTQKLYKRFLVVAAGPIFNLILAFFIILLVFWKGKPVEGTTVGNVATGTSAWVAGLRSQDKVLALNGQPVTYWNQMDRTLRKMEAGQSAVVKVLRQGTELDISVPLTKVRAKNDYGEEIEVTGIKTISPYPHASQVGVSDPKSVAYQSGLRTGDLILKINNRSVERFEELGNAFFEEWGAAGPEKKLTILVKRGENFEAKEKSMKEVSLLMQLPSNQELIQSKKPVLEILGIHPADTFVKQVSPKSAAEAGGVKVGDRVVTIKGIPVLSFDIIVDQVQQAGTAGEGLPFVLEREGNKVEITLKPIETIITDPLTHQPLKKNLVGISPLGALRETQLSKIQYRNPVQLVKETVKETYEISYKMLMSLIKLVVGQISVKNLGGPLMIASVAGKSLDAGIIPFLQMMALISINLFLLNLFPIPVLDGGHLLFFTVEAIKGKPVSVRTMEIANQAGMVFILFLVGLTLFNDVSRFLVH